MSSSNHQGMHDHDLRDLNLDDLRDELELLKEEAIRHQPISEAWSELITFILMSLSLSAVGWGAVIYLSIRGVPLSTESVFTLATQFTLPLLACAALAMGKFSRWILAHHLCHKAYNKLPSLPRFLHSDSFGQRGFGRALWIDWMPGEAWCHEHNIKHHAFTNVPTMDPDVVFEKSWWLRSLNIPPTIKLIIMVIGALVWKPLYYGPNTLIELTNANKSPSDKRDLELYSWRAWSPFQINFWRVMMRSWLPYLTICFAIPIFSIFFIVGPKAALTLLYLLLITELMTNAHAFIMIVPNHAGEDLYVFSTKTKSRGEYYLRQILSSCNYKTGHSINDFLHGYLNYQIEHHLWPDLTMGQYRWLQPRVKTLCARYHIPYVQESVWWRLRKLSRIVTGRSTPPQWLRDS